MTKHTPGPWEVSGFPKSEGFSILTGKGRCVAERYPAAVSEKEGEEMEANARLIAAAPELLKACKAAFVIIRDMDGEVENTVKDFVQQAIAHAESSQ
jgi:hypothetical protein